MCLCIYVSIYVSMYLCIYVSMSAHMHACMHACMYVCMHACMHACMNACLHVCLSVWLAGCLAGCLSVSLSVCLSVSRFGNENEYFERGSNKLEFFKTFKIDSMKQWEFYYILCLGLCSMGVCFCMMLNNQNVTYFVRN